MTTPQENTAPAGIYRVAARIVTGTVRIDPGFHRFFDRTAGFFRCAALMFFLISKSPA